MTKSSPWSLTPAVSVDAVSVDAVESVDAGEPVAPVTPSAGQRSQLGVPWGTVITLAAVMAYADGFWMTALRGAVGSIDRTQQPFTSWWRESTLLVPLFVLAVLGALTLAQRRFGPTLSTPRKVLAGALLVTAAGTIVGLAAIVGSSVYDYRLESDQLVMMNSMHGICAGDCLAQAQQSTVAALVRGVLYVCGFLLLTNLVLVGWMIALRGGRLSVSTPRRITVDADGAPRPADTRSQHIRVLLVAGLLGSAVIHAVVVPEHLAEWPAAGVFFVLLAAAELAVGGLVMASRHRAVLVSAAVVSAGPLALWLLSRTAGLPFGPAIGQPEAVGLPDIICCVLEIGTLLASAVLLRGGSWLRGPAASAHLRGLAVVAVIAVTAIGLAGSMGLPGGDSARSDGHSEMVMTN